MKLCKISLKAYRGSNPDLVIEVEGITITIPRLDKLQRYNIGSLIYGGVAKVELPCELGEVNSVEMEKKGVRD